MYRLATMHSVTDGQTDIQQYDSNSRLYCVQYDRLKGTLAQFKIQTYEVSQKR